MTVGRTKILWLLRLDGDPGLRLCSTRRWPVVRTGGSTLMQLPEMWLIRSGMPGDPLSITDRASAPLSRACERAQVNYAACCQIHVMSAAI